ncbi:MAG: DUF2007 domain-containing protein [Lysobacterales bacterium]
MKIVYHADHIIDANLVKSILENAGYRAFINGEFLAGAMGELPAGGLIQVVVADSDEDDARKIVSDFEKERQEFVAQQENEEDAAGDDLAGVPV